MTSKYVDGINEKNMDLFLAALRSGEYYQGIGRLSKFEEVLEAGEWVGKQQYCCLGVGCEVGYLNDAPITKTQWEADNDYTVYNSERLLAPLELLDWLGIPDKNRSNEGMANEYNIKFYEPSPWQPGREHYVTASELNDDLGASFADVADVFENEFLRRES